MNADLAVKLFKDFKVTGSYVKAFTNEKSALGHGDRDSLFASIIVALTSIRSVRGGLMQSG